MGLESDPQWQEMVTRINDGVTQPENIFAEICKTKEIDGARVQSIINLLIRHDAAMFQPL